jgi:hypothetical protein
MADRPATFLRVTVSLSRLFVYRALSWLLQVSAVLVSGFDAFNSTVIFDLARLPRLVEELLARA